MLRRSTLSQLLLLALLLPANFVYARAGDEHHQMKIGKTGELMFEQTMHVGAAMLQPGHYRFQHRIEGSEHYVLFTLLKGIHGGSGELEPPSGAEDVAKIKCRVTPLNNDKKVRSTRMLWKSEGGDIGRIEEIQVRGETVAHTF